MADSNKYIDMSAKEALKLAKDMLDVYAKLDTAEEQVQQGKVLDAGEGLKSIREKYNV